MASTFSSSTSSSSSRSTSPSHSSSSSRSSSPSPSRKIPSHTPAQSFMLRFRDEYAALAASRGHGSEDVAGDDDDDDDEMMRATKTNKGKRSPSSSSPRLAADAQTDPVLVRHLDEHGTFYTCDEPPLSRELLAEQQESMDGLHAEVDDLIRTLLPRYATLTSRERATGAMLHRGVPGAERYAPSSSSRIVPAEITSAPRM